LIRQRGIAQLALAAAFSLALGQACAAQAQVGEKLFKMQCAVCHSATAGAANRQGPNLFGITGQPAALVPGMVYSAAFKKALDGQTWTDARLDKWLENAQEMVPDSVMMYQQSDPEKRRAIIVYLNTLQ
jgi:cytochrome c